MFSRRGGVRFADRERERERGRYPLFAEAVKNLTLISRRGKLRGREGGEDRSETPEASSLRRKAVYEAKDTRRGKLGKRCAPREIDDASRRRRKFVRER